MGYRLMFAVTDQRWTTRLSHPALCVLLTMARHALDERAKDGAPAARYFGGHERLVASLRPGKPDGADERVRRAVAELVDLGAITRLVDHPHSGERQVYGLDALLAPTEESPTEKVPLVPHFLGGESPPEKVPPMNHEEPRT